MELERFLGEIDDHPPAGVDLDESGELLQLDQLSKWTDPEGDPDWVALRDASAGALERSRDLRAGVYLAAALLHTDGIVVFCEAIGLLRNFVESLWDSVYPLPDGDDVMERSSAVFNLTNFHKVIRPLRRAPLVEDRVAGRFSLFDVEIAQGKVDPPVDMEGDPPQEAHMLAAFQSADLAALEALKAAAEQAERDIQRIEEIFRDKAGVEMAPDLKRLQDPIHQIATLVATRLGERSESAAPDGATADTGMSPEPAAPSPAVAAGGDGVIRSRQDAIRTIDRIIQYFRATEPSSPVPLVLERAKRLVDMDFMAILEDMAPDAVAQVKKISGQSGDG